MPSKRNHILCAIVDIDGTLADCHHRRHHVEKTPKDWDSFFDHKLIMRDKLIKPVWEVVMALHERFPILYCSGRRENERSITEKWLYKHGLWNHPRKLYMRQDGDRRSDVEVKRELLAQIRKDCYEPIVVLDDRQSVVDMWREEKLTCLQVAKGDF